MKLYVEGMLNPIYRSGKEVTYQTSNAAHEYNASAEKWQHFAKMLSA